MLYSAGDLSHKFIFPKPLMNHIKKTLSRWKAPISLAAIMLVAYGLMLPSLGYSFDDWNFIYYATRGLEGFTEVFHYDGHPQAIWSYLLGIEFLGYAPLNWHLLSLFLRTVSVIVFWLVLHEIWPKNQRENFFAAALFALHPIYNLQVFSITFYEIWIGYTFIFLSFLFTVKAIKTTEKRAFYIALAILFRIAFIFTKEYAWFVELMRPMLIWFALPSTGNFRKKTRNTIKAWAPYLAIFMATVFWRGFLYIPTRKAFAVNDSLISSPFGLIVDWAVNIIPDNIYVLITSWSYVLRADFLYFKRPFNVLVFIITVIIAGALFVYFQASRRDTSPSWARAAFITGIPSLLFGVVPFYIAQYTIYQTEFPFNARFAIGMLPGAALATAAFIEYWIAEPKKKILTIAILLSLLISWHIRYTNDFKKIWAYQENLLQQITWRVPGLEEGSALFIYETGKPGASPNSPARLAALVDFPAARAINTIYEMTPEDQARSVSFWAYFSLNELDNLPENKPLSTGHATSSFEGNTEKALVFLFSPDEGQCLHLIKAGDENYNKYPDEIKEIAPYLSTDVISPQNGMQTEIRDQLLGDNKNNWCYYYQHAELAKEAKAWHEIVGAWEEAVQLGYKPKHGLEYMPFIEAYARTSQWDTAVALTVTAKRTSHAMSSTLCPLWQNIADEMLQSNEKDIAIQTAYQKLDCSP